MKPEEQLMAIAVACGKKCGDDCWYEQVGDQEHQHRSDCPCNGTGWNIPDYLNDLNAMHEVEMTLGNKLPDYSVELMDVVIRVPDPDYPRITPRCYIWHASAAQRSEAFLRTLGLWKEEE